MPLTALAHRPRSSIPLWRRLLARADAAALDLAALWLGWFQSARRRARQTDWTDVFAEANSLGAQSRVPQIWEQTVDRPARRLLLPPAMALVEQAAEDTMHDLSALVDREEGFVTGLPETEQQVAAYLGTQIYGIGTTSMRTVQRVLRQGWQESLSAQSLAVLLAERIALTPRQDTTLSRLRTRLQDEGLPSRQITRTAERAAQMALRQRVEIIGRTQSVTMVNQGSYLGVQMAPRLGIIAAEQVRRFWKTAEDEKVCSRCAPIPELNLDGVGIDEPFKTPEGDLLYPAVHARCRCMVRIEIV